MHTIEDRANEYVGSPHRPNENLITKIQRDAYTTGAADQRRLTFEAFDDWLLRNYYMEQSFHDAVEELRNILRKI